MKTEIVLSGIGYFVEVQDLQVIFTESRPVANVTVTQFAFERPRDINDSNGIWYLCWLETSKRGVVASHIEQALSYCRENFGASFENYKGALA